MTIEDRVDDIGDWRNPDARNHAIRVMRAAVKAAVEEERAACAYIADCVMHEMDTESDGVDTEESNALRSETAIIIRNRIRARSEK